MLEKVIRPPVTRRSGATTVEVLAEHLASMSFAAAPPDVRQKVEDCLLHGLVVAAGAGETSFPAVVRQVIAESLCDEGSTVLLRIGRAPAATAAWANAVLLHSRVQEDTHDTVHPGVAVVPAALAVAEREGTSGAAFLDAVLRGYEVATALSSTWNRRVTPPMRATGAFGPVAAAAAAASLVGLDAEGIGRALALAASMAGGTTESFAAGTQEWHFQAGQVSQTGVTAADLARAGVPASRQAFEGPGGYLAAYAGGAEPDDTERVVRRLAAGWGILEVTFKPYPVCAFNQAPAAAAVDLAARVDPARVVRLEIRMSPSESHYPGVDNAGPVRTPEQAIMSAQCAVAAALLDGNVTFRRLQQPNAEMTALMTRARVVPDVGLRDKSAVVRAELDSGEYVESRSPDMDAALQWSHDDVLANAERLLPETTLDHAALRGLAGAIAALPTAPTLDGLLSALP